ncbi:MAG: HIT domain-containing protein [Candidatus Omnitrophica bacterium]|nr:HIT domain-containing protein [Candidatus Omnitrophota bacterium]
MDKLWAPWRSKYIYLRKRTGCIFCGAKKEADAKRRYILERSEHSFSILNIFPYNNGHVMVAPYRHVKSLELLSSEELLDMMRLVNKTKAILDRKLKPHGYNIGLNIGKTAGAGYAGHLHIHIVPRWTGDTNFMPVTAGSRVISESLDAVYRLLKSK